VPTQGYCLSAPVRKDDLTNEEIGLRRISDTESADRPMNVKSHESRMGTGRRSHIASVLVQTVLLAPSTAGPIQSVKRRILMTEQHPLRSNGMKSVKEKTGFLCGLRI
jgi:hypothetical protein